MSNKLLRGTFILTLGTYISRFLGMIYVIPFFALVGNTGNALYQMGYAQYTIFLSIATMGFPMAISKYVSKYNAMGDYQTSRRMFKAGLSVMLVTGIIAFGILYFLAPFLANIALAQNDATGIKLDDVILVIRMVSIALIIVPIMALIRGFFQGHQMMGPTAVSQVVEQIVRIAFLLGSVYLVLKVYDGDLVTAVGYATFAAFVGAIGGFIVLIIFWLSKRRSLISMRENLLPSENPKLTKMFGEVFTYAGPFVFVGLAIPLYNYIDTSTFIRAMTDAGFAQNEAVNEFGMVVANIPKLIMIPVSLATAFGLTLVPTVTKSFTDGHLSAVRQQIDQTFQTIVFFILPAVVGIAVLAGPAYTFFFDNNPRGIELLIWYAPVALLFSFFTVTAAILQGINKQKLAVISLAFGLIIKLLINEPLINAYQGVGSILATAIGFTASLIYSFAMIKRHVKYSYKRFIKRSLFIAILTTFMGLLVSVLQSILSIFIQYSDGKMQSLIICLIAIGIGISVYFYLAYRSHLLEKLFGSKLPFNKRRGKA